MSAGAGPRASMPSRLSASTAGAISRPSSSPIAPCSPACGLRPATASRGRVDAEQRPEPGCSDAACANDLDGVKRAHRLGQGQVDGHRHDAQFGTGEHHGDVDPARQLGEILRMAGMPEACVLQGLLLDGIGHQAGNLASQGQLGAALDGLQGGRRVDRVGMAGPRKDVLLAAAARAAPSRRPGRHRPAARSGGPARRDRACRPGRSGGRRRRG